MQYTGSLQKLTYRLAEPLEYFLSIGKQSILLNPYLSKKISLTFAGKIHCQHCGRATKKSFNQGYCFPCSQTLARCDFCIVRPEKCHHHLGSCREPEWATTHCFIPHIIYLANTSGIKVGITRETQIPTRFVDQGATQALPLFKVQNRLHSGLIEVYLKQFLNDKTDWRKMLKGENEDIDLRTKREELLKEFDLEELQALLQSSSHNNHAAQHAHENSLTKSETSLELIKDAALLNFQYPVLEYPKKVSSCNFEKTPEVTGILLGIKGQYLILDVGVINLRNLAGFVFSISFE